MDNIYPARYVFSHSHELFKHKKLAIVCYSGAYSSLKWEKSDELRNVLDRCKFCFNLRV